MGKRHRERGERKFDRGIEKDETESVKWQRGAEGSRGGGLITLEGIRETDTILFLFFGLFFFNRKIASEKV